eukprot:5102287-Prymnesium_polylepis.2
MPHAACSPPKLIRALSDTDHSLLIFLLRSFRSAITLPAAKFEAASSSKQYINRTLSLFEGKWNVAQLHASARTCLRRGRRVRHDRVWTKGPLSRWA